MISRAENGPLDTGLPSSKTDKGEKQANPTPLCALWPSARDSRSGVTFTNLHCVGLSPLEILRR